MPGCHVFFENGVVDFRGLSGEYALGRVGCANRMVFWGGADTSVMQQLKTIDAGMIGRV